MHGLPQHVRPLWVKSGSRLGQASSNKPGLPIKIDPEQILLSQSMSSTTPSCSAADRSQRDIVKVYIKRVFVDFQQWNV
jgi:hypothetical protein